MSDDSEKIYDSNIEFNEWFDEINTIDQTIQNFGDGYTPSKLLITINSNAYIEAVKNWKSSLLDEALGNGNAHEDLFLRNRERFKEIVKIVRRGKIIPFVGAGLSKPCGYPTWHEYLTRLCGVSNAREQVSPLIENGNLEEAADILFSDLNEARFNEHSNRIFGAERVLDGAIKLLPKIANSCVITTNFDDVIERAYADEHKAFSHVVNGNVAGEFHRALAKGERHLLKIHGRYDDTGSRIFCQREYLRAYGDGRFDFSLPLPDTLSRVYRNYCLLFLGCGLSHDRTLDLFAEIVRTDGEHKIPRHYAILEAPNAMETDEERIEIEAREAQLSRLLIFPIWFPKGSFEFVEKIMACLADEDFN